MIGKFFFGLLFVIILSVIVVLGGSSYARYDVSMQKREPFQVDEAEISPAV